MKVTMDDVAHKAGVSKTTVSHVINKSRAVSQEAVLRVNQAINELDYKVNTIARNLRSGNSHMIGFIVTNLTNYFYINVGAGLNAVLKPKGYRLFYVNSNEDAEIERQNIQDMVMHSTDGLIIAPTANNCSYMQDIIPDSLPTLFIDRKPVGFIRDTVLPTNSQGVYEAVDYLIKRGHTRIGFIGSRKNDTMNERHNGYLQALADNSLSHFPELDMIGEVPPAPMHDLLEGPLYRAMEQYLAACRPTALMIGNGLAAIGVFNYLKKHAYKIPEEIALVAFDDSFWYSTATPTISAVMQDPFEIGVQAGKILLKRLKKKTARYQDVRIPTKFIRRESC
ncbi:MAG: LacI family transcriptional regulator [Spirochaetia bacterium]|nr:LacI family transcriptional regulator [Spirochaetia bacterium]